MKLHAVDFGRRFTNSNFDRLTERFPQRDPRDRDQDQDDNVLDGTEASIVLVKITRAFERVGFHSLIFQF